MFQWKVRLAVAAALVLASAGGFIDWFRYWGW